MTKNELVKAMAEKSDGLLTQREVTLALELLGKVAIDVIAREDSVKIAGICTVSGVRKDACQRRNPATGEMVDVPSKIHPRCRFSANLKKAINE